MKITQIQLPDTFNEMIHFLDKLKKDNEDNEWIIFFGSQRVASKILPLESVWDIHSLACNLLDGSSILVRFE